MTSENHGTEKADSAMVMSPTGSTSQAAPLSPSTSKPIQELPDELVQAGWSKCWSKRENRPYYFNRFTNQSLWEMPVLGQHDVISDPLGLNAAPASGEAVSDTGLGNGQRKRHPSEDAQAGPNSFKRPKVEIPVTPTTPTVPISPSTPGVKPWVNTTDDKQGQTSVPAPAPYRPSVVYWDLDVQTNAVIRERAPANHLPSHPEIELQRAQLTTKLRQHYHELCSQREGIEPPRESFNRWLLERKVVDKGLDPLLPSECDPVISPSMFREIMNDIPIRLSRIKYKEEARKLLFKYAEAAKKMIDSRNATPDSRKVVKWNVEDTMNWLRRDHSASKEDYMDRLEHLRKQCGPHVASVAKDSVEGICSKIYHISAEYVRRIRQAHLTLLKECNISVDGTEPTEVQDRLVYCYPVRLSIPSPPQPRVELHFENDVACLRYKGEMVKVNRGHFSKLELLYRYSCIDDFKCIEPPRESFNRWLLERKVVDKGLDLFLPSECDPVISPSMFREIMNDIPIRLSRIKYKEEARKLLFKYAEAAKKMIDSRNATPDSRKVVKWNVEDTMNWLRRDHSASKEDYMDRLEHLRKQCGPHVASVAKDSVEGICSKIYHISAEYVRRIRQAHLTLLKECNISVDGTEPTEVQDRLVYCYPVRLSIPSPPQPRVELHFENDVACLRYKGEMVKVNRGHFSKLELLYRYSCIDDPRFEKFLCRVWCLNKRYQVMFGSGVNEGSGLQGALPVPVFEALNKQFGVTFECFASPLNCYFKQFCSAFPDIDGFFGSRGPFFSFSPASGSFEANPPFCEELMDAMVKHFEDLLEHSSEPLSFIIFVPEWRDPPTPALTRMEASRFRRHQMIVPAFEHEYRSGSQHICKREEMYYKSVHGTAVIFLQNNAGFSKWEPTTERIQEFLAAYNVSGRSLPSPGPPSTSTGDKDSKPVQERLAKTQDDSSPVDKTAPDTTNI
ncbi:phosphorylated CTD-interacting factor 1-like [Sinocyclocheilus grahami]|uniref:phosphorylated CTD-interacting factor 1-like n=1 Tax=Sinocyclocheilus grahami TaxID=75366 RepID=UPI0007AC7EFF|nr:PREDICTED: phosphorylated CTD-interacting factor 1-like [Sinocyclocheilus grahami]